MPTKDFVETVVSAAIVAVVSILNSSAKAQLNDVVLIGAAISATIGVWKLVLKPFTKRLDKIVEMSEEFNSVTKRLDDLELLVKSGNEDKQPTVNTSDKRDTQ